MSPWKEQVFRTSRVLFLRKYSSFSRLEVEKTCSGNGFRSGRKMNKIAPFPCHLHALHVVVCTRIVAVCDFCVKTE